MLVKVLCCAGFARKCLKKTASSRYTLILANHFHFVLQRLIWLFQSVSNYVGANYCPYIRSAFFHELLFKKRKSYLHEILDVVYSWVISAMDLQAKAAELIAPGSQLSEDAALTLHCFFSQSFTEQRCILICSPLKLYQMLKCEENYSSFVFLIFKCVVPKDLWQFIKTGYVARAGEKSYPSLLICCLFPSEICSYFRQHIVSQWLFFFS